MRAPVSGPLVVGDPDAAFSAATKIIEAEYEIPFQGHSSFAGAHALADPSNGQMTVYTNDMKSYSMRRGIATFLGMTRDAREYVAFLARAAARTAEAGPPDEGRQPPLATR